MPGVLRPPQGPCYPRHFYKIGKPGIRSSIFDTLASSEAFQYTVRQTC